ncbi:reverse transcriptase domain-containing protein [Tanacetum coccineum]
MKLNPKKCTFGVEEGMFLGYQVNTKGIKICPDKVDAVLSLQSPKCLKDVQKLSGKLASLNRFLAKSAEKSLPFFKTLKKCTKKSDFLWTEEAEAAFKQMKEHIAKLPMLIAPEEQEELIGEFGIHYRPRVYVKGQVLANFIVERQEEEGKDDSAREKEPLPARWTLFTGRSHLAVDGAPRPKKIRREKLNPISSPVAFYKMGYDMAWTVPGGGGEGDWTFGQGYRETTTIAKPYSSIYHGKAESNGLVERANRSLGEGIKARLGKENKNWLEEISHLLWVHRTMIKSSNGDTPFSLTYGTVGCINPSGNWNAPRSVGQLKKAEEQAAIREAKRKRQMEKYYNTKVRNTSFKPGDVVYRSNEASRVEDTGKLGPKWEGPYEVMEALGKGSYKLKDRNGKESYL